MSQIHINILKQGLKSDKILSVSFFTLQDPYRDFTKYQKYLERFYEYAKALPDFEVRVYTDDTGSEFAVKSAESQDHVSVYHFDCPQFREGTGHQGLFSAMIRFMPLFEKHDTVWISDIDIMEHFLDKTLLTKMETNKCKFLICPYPCYFRKSFIQKYTIIAHRIISKIHFPKTLFTRFLQNMIDGNLDKKLTLLNNENIFLYRKLAYTVPYCTDELFLNTSIYEHLQSHQYKIQIETDLLLAIASIPDIMRHHKLVSDDEHLSLYRYRRNPVEKHRPTALKILKKVFKHEAKKYPCFKTLEDKVDQGIIEESFAIKSSEL
jgi:hypothetical protein